MSKIDLHCVCLFILHTNEYVQVLSVSKKYNVYDLATIASKSFLLPLGRRKDLMVDLLYNIRTWT